MTGRYGVDRLSQLPNEILLMILSHLPSMSDFRSVANLSWRFTRRFGPELYLEFGRKFDWLPLFVGAMRGDINLLERCLKLDAPIDQIATSDRICQTSVGWFYDPTDWWEFVYVFNRPIHTAIEHRQLGTVRWLLKHGADPGRPGYLKSQGDSSSTPLMWCLCLFEHRIKSGILDIIPVTFEIFRALLEAKADPNVNDINLGHPLRKVLSEWFIHHRLGFVYLAILLKYGADPKQLCKHRHVDHTCSLDSSRIKSQPEPDTNCV